MEDGHRPKDRRGAVPLLGGTAPVLTKQHRKFDYLALFFDTSCAVLCEFKKALLFYNWSVHKRGHEYKDPRGVLPL